MNHLLFERSMPRTGFAPYAMPRAIITQKFKNKRIFSRGTVPDSLRLVKKTQPYCCISGKIKVNRFGSKCISKAVGSGRRGIRITFLVYSVKCCNANGWRINREIIVDECIAVRPETLVRENSPAREIINKRKHKGVANHRSFCICVIMCFKILFYNSIILQRHQHFLRVRFPEKQTTEALSLPMPSPTKSSFTLLLFTDVPAFMGLP